jgi:hypothetical protein
MTKTISSTPKPNLREKELRLKRKNKLKSRFKKKEPSKAKRKKLFVAKSYAASKTRKSNTICKKRCPLTRK